MLLGEDSWSHIDCSFSRVPVECPLFHSVEIESVILDYFLSSSIGVECVRDGSGICVEDLRFRVRTDGINFNGLRNFTASNRLR